MAVCFLAYQRFQNLTLKWKEAHARNKVELEQPLDPQPPTKKQQVSVSTQKLHKSWWPLGRGGGGKCQCVVCDSFAFERPYLSGPPEDRRHLPALDSRASWCAAIWMADGSGQEIGLGVSPRRTVCILKKATLNACPPIVSRGRVISPYFAHPGLAVGGWWGDSFQPGRGEQPAP